MTDGSPTRTARAALALLLGAAVLAALPGSFGAAEAQIPQAGQRSGPLEPKLTVRQADGRDQKERSRYRPELPEARPDPKGPRVPGDKLPFDRSYRRRGFVTYDRRSQYDLTLPERPETAAPEPGPGLTAPWAEPLLGSDADAPPDLEAPRTVLLPRGAGRPEPAYEVGERLTRPHVTLDWRTYGLPRPGPGRLYARVEGDVLVIDAATREVVAVVDPDLVRAE